MTHANRQRGETTLTVGQTTYVLCLSLGALAELETALGITDLTEIGNVLSKPSASKLTDIMVALLHGGAGAMGAAEGQAQLDAAVVNTWPLSIPNAMEAIKGTFALASAEDQASPPADAGTLGEPAKTE